MTSILASDWLDVFAVNNVIIVWLVPCLQQFTSALFSTTQLPARARHPPAAEPSMMYNRKLQTSIISLNIIDLSLLIFQNSALAKIGLGYFKGFLHRTKCLKYRELYNSLSGFQVYCFGSSDTMCHYFSFSRCLLPVDQMFN